MIVGSIILRVAEELVVLEGEVLSVSNRNGETIFRVKRERQL